MLIREDEHSLYVITNSSVYRPVMGRWCYTNKAYLNSNRIESEHKVGDKVKGGAINQTPFAKVGGETWCYHGSSPELMNVSEGRKIKNRPAAWDPQEKTIVKYIPELEDSFDEWLKEAVALAMEADVILRIRETTPRILGGTE